MKNRSAIGRVQFIIGILMIILGIFAFTSPEDTLFGFIILCGAMAVAIGICDIIFYVKAERFTGFGPIVAMISGILSVMAGIMLLVYPNTGKLVLTLLIPIWFISHCISQLVNLIENRFIIGGFHYFISIVINILGLIMGFLMLLQPVLSLFTASFMIGVYLVVLGVGSVMLAYSNMGSR